MVSDVERPKDLPEYARPPLDEVVVGVHFHPLAEYSDFDAYRYFSSLPSEQQGRVESRPGLMSASDFLAPFAPSAIPQLTMVPPGARNRIWLSAPDETYLTQIQQDLFLMNWRKRSMPYPRFEAVVSEFSKAWDGFQNLLASSERVAPVITQLEVTYVNWIPDLSIAEFFQGGKSLVPSEFNATDIEHHVLNWTSNIGPIENRIGRLNIDCQSAWRAGSSDWIKGSNFTLTVRLSPHEFASLELGFLFARKTIVKAFDDLTTPLAHEHWSNVS
jgi:uncharacterized protein (TIGR04255 family)